jgi:hypothetical protein
VFLLDPVRKTVKRQSIRTGRMADELIEVLGGLEVGQQVVIQGAAFLADGETVRIADPRLAEAARESGTRPE